MLGDRDASMSASSRADLMNRIFTAAERAGIKGRNCGELFEIEHVVLNILKEQVKRTHARNRLLRLIKERIS